MKIIETENYDLIKPTENSVSTFFDVFISKKSLLQKKHLILDFSDFFNITLAEIMLFLKNSNYHKQHGTSFVIICKEIEIDELPDNMDVVPTLEEAQDILEMNKIERDLGF